MTRRFTLLFWLATAVFLAACGQSDALVNQVAELSAVKPTATIAPTATPAPACEPFTTPPPPAAAEAPTYGYRILNTYPHDANAFTQGLLWHNGVLYESTGLEGQSSLRRVDLTTGAVEQQVDVPAAYFAEGLALWQDRLIQLTWQAGTAFVYDRETFAPVGQFTYDTQGWGLTTDGRCLIMSDGSATLTFRDPDTFEPVGQIQAVYNEQPLTRLNELEYIDGVIWANVWQTNIIAQIDPATGQVTAIVDLTGLLDMTAVTQPVDVLNGIAYDAENGRLFVTGKLWPALYEIELVPPAG